LKIALSLVLIAVSCVQLPHVDRAPRTPGQQVRAAVLVESDCGSTDITNPDAWSRSAAESGVAVSERHVLTALHGVACAVLPSVHVTTYDGVRRRAVVVKEDATSDLALLELAAADNFNLNIAPPVVAHVEIGSIVCTPHPGRCGQILSNRASVFFAMLPRHGESGSGIYSQGGELISIVNRGYPPRNLGSGSNAEAIAEMLRGIP
jgi:hypothetical protein